MTATRTLPSFGRTAALLLLLVPALGLGQALAPLPDAPQAAFRALGTDADGFAHVWVQGEDAALRAAVEGLGGRVKYASGEGDAPGTVRLAAAVPRAAWRALAAHPAVTRWEGSGTPVVPLGDLMLMRSRADSVHLGAAPLPRAFTGKGVVVGLVDIGIDPDHPDLRDSLGRTRVRWVWDQTLPADGTEPAPYGYGQTCDSAAIEAAACNHVDPFNYYSHGTGVTGIAAGNGLGLGRYKGVAPEADIVAVNTDLGGGFTANVADAVRFIFDYAESVGKPCVINTSVGTYLGSHDGKDAAALAIDALLGERPGRAVVAAVGNAGDRVFHLGYEASADTAFTWFEHVPSLGAAYLQLWIDTAQARGWRLNVGANDPATWADQGAGPWLDLTADFSLSGAAFDSTSFDLAGLGEVQVWLQRQGRSYFVEVIVFPVLSDRLWRLSTTGSGRFDAWSDPGVTGTSYFPRGSDLPDAAAFPDILRYRAPDDQQTLVSSWQCSDRVVTVGSYYNRDTMTNYYGANPPISGTVGERIASSSNGPTRDGRVKPDLSASGQWVLAPASGASSSWLISLGAATYIAQGGLHYLQGGTSFSSPIVAGVAALYLERYPDADWRAVKEALLSSARADAFTGPALPDVQWGYGKVNAFGALQVPDSACAVPQGITVTHVLDTAARIEWLPVPGAEAYRLEGRRVGTDRWVTRGALSTVEIVPNLRPATLYEFRVRALCGIVDTSAWSTYFPFVTAAARSGEALPAAGLSPLAEVAPNPVGARARLRWAFAGQADGWWFELTDLAGRRVATLPLPGASGTLDWSRGGLAPGSYFYRFHDGTRTRASGGLVLE